MKQDYFIINTTETTKEQFKVLIKLVKKHSRNINIFEQENDLYFNVQNILNFGEYFKDISNYSYYNNAKNITEQEFLKVVSDYNLRNDLLECVKNE